jgi:hypothetical protein
MDATVICGCVGAEGLADLDCWDCGGSGVVLVEEEPEGVEIEDSAGMGSAAGAQGLPIFEVAGIRQ